MELMISAVAFAIGLIVAGCAIGLGLKIGLCHHAKTVEAAIDRAAMNDERVAAREYEVAKEHQTFRTMEDLRHYRTQLLITTLNVLQTKLEYYKDNLSEPERKEDALAELDTLHEILNRHYNDIRPLPVRRPTETDS